MRSTKHTSWMGNPRKQANAPQAQVRDRWESHWREVGETDPRDASWLSPWARELGAVGGWILDLGCGAGIETRALTELGASVIALDYTRSALARVCTRAPDARSLVADLARGIPLRGQSVYAVVATLSLHYFDEVTTDLIITDIARCLVRGGLLIARVNSTRDVHYGAASEVELEPHLYQVGGHPKRFYDRDDILRFFGKRMRLESIEESPVGITPEKYTWLISARRAEADHVGMR